MFDYEKIIDNLTVPAFSGVAFAYLFGDIKPLAIFFSVLIIADLLSAWNLRSVNALKNNGTPNGSWFYGLWLAWNDGTLNPEAMRDKFIPKCLKYLGALIMINVFMGVSKHYGFAEASTVSSVMISVLMGIELKSIARNLKQAESSMYQYFGVAIDEHYNRKYGQPAETDQSVNNDIIQVEEGKQP